LRVLSFIIRRGDETMLPKGADIRIEEDVLYWENHTDLLTVKEAQVISNEIRSLVEKNPLKGMIVDNRKLEGPWPPEVDRVWIDLMAFLPQHDLKTATVCQSVINKLQFNYLSSQAGTAETVKAFVDDERDALCLFLKVEDVKL
jgi:hypothetical protein